MTPHTTITKPNLAPWNNTPLNNTYRNPIKPTKSIKNQEFKERRLKVMYFWCDEKFVSRHKCRNKRLYSLSIMEEDEGFTEEEASEEGLKLDALKGTIRLNTIKVTRKLTG